MSLSQTLETKHCLLSIYCYACYFVSDAQKLDIYSYIFVTDFYVIKMNFLRNPKLLFSSTLLMNMCKGHMSLCMSLKDSCFTKSLLKKFVNTQLLMTIGGGGRGS